MARNYGRFTTDIWRDKKFRALSRDAQWAYFMLGTQPDITAAGLLSLTVKRWSGYASDATPDALSDALSELASKRFVIIDEHTEELLVRAFVKWDGGLSNRNRRPVVLDAVHAIASPELRGVMAYELRDLDEPGDVWQHLLDAPIDAAWHAHADAASTSDRVVVKQGELVPPTHIPQPATPLPARNAPTAQKRGTRLPDDWTPDEKTRAWTLERIPERTAAVELEKFRYYWIAKTGKDATKLDWPATWRKWVLSCNASARARPQQQTDDLFDRAARRMGVTP